MSNVFHGASEDNPLHEQYDLKGSTHSRTNSKPGNGPAKDLDWKKLQRRMVIPLHIHRKLERQMSADVAWLKSQNIMDYSLLVGISNQQQQGQTEGWFSRLWSRLGGGQSDGLDSFRQYMGGIKAAPQPFPPATGEDGASSEEIPPNSEGQAPQPPAEKLAEVEALMQKGVVKPEVYEKLVETAKPSSEKGDDSGDAEAHVYWCGIIDILQPFNTRKKIESAVKGQVTAGGKNAVSCADPPFYAQRFLNFMLNDVLLASDEEGAGAAS